MADSNSALGLTPPHPRLYETSEGEQRVLGQITPENVGGLYGFLLGQRGQAQRNQDEYAIQLNKSNDLQNAIAHAKLKNDRLHNNQTFYGNLTKEGLPLSVAINATGGTDSLQPFMNSQQMAVGTLQGDRLAALRTEASALEAAGKGLQAGREAGVTLDPGQRISGAQGMIGARATTGTALDLEVEALRNAGRAATAKSDGSAGRIIGKIDTLGGEPQWQVVGSDPQRVFQLTNQLKDQQAGLNRGEVERRGGNYNPQGASPTAPSAQPAAKPNPRAARVLTPEQGRATAAEVIRSNPALKGARFHSQSDSPEGTILRFTVPGQPQPVPYVVK